MLIRTSSDKQVYKVQGNFRVLYSRAKSSCPKILELIKKYWNGKSEIENLHELKLKALAVWDKTKLKEDA